MDLMTKILVLTEVGFSERDYFRWGIFKIKNFFKVKILDLTKMSYPIYFEAHKEKVYKIEDYHQIENINEAKNLIEEFNPIFALDNMTPFSENSKIIRKILKNKKIKTIHIQSGLVPAVKRKIFEKIYRFIFLILRPRILYNKISKIFRLKLHGQNKEKNCDIIFLSGLKGLNKIIKNKKIIYSHSYDYEFYLNYVKASKKPKNIFKNSIVFLDQFLPFHPGAIMRGEKPKATKENYYPALNDFFSLLEDKTKKQIIIASHPRADYSKENPFQNRQIVENKTVELVENADIILAHTSTSISFAVLFEKPIIFLTSDEIIKSYDDFRIHSLSRELGSALINIDKLKSKLENINLELISKINNKKYADYKQNYIKHPSSKNISMWEIMVNILINKIEIKN